MKKTALILSLAALSLTSCGGRNIRTATDITPENCTRVKLDWRYGAGDIRIQTSKLNRQLMDRWYSRAGWYMSERTRPRLLITEVDNHTDMYVSTDMIRDIFEEVAVNDGRYTVVVGNPKDEKELDRFLAKYSDSSKYSEKSRPEKGEATAAQFLTKVRLSKATTDEGRYLYEDYRMTVTLYDIESQELVDSASDVLKKRVRR